MWSEFYDELKKRRVLPTGGAYLLFASAVIQVVATVQPYVRLPFWSVGAVITILAFGLPVVLIIAWAYDWQDRTHESRVRRIGRVVTAAAMVILLIVGAGAFVWRKQQPELVDDRIVVSPFTNLTRSPDLEPIGRLASDWLAEGITHMDVASVVPSQDILAWWARERPAAANEDPGRILAFATGARILVTGSYYRDGDSILISARILDVLPRTPRLLGATPTIKGSAANPISAIDSLSRRVMGVLARHFSATGTTAETDVSMPDYRAWMTFSSGFDRWVNGDPAGAVALYQQAARADTAMWARASIMQLLPLAQLRQYARADSVLHSLEARQEELDPAKLTMIRGWRRMLDGGMPESLSQPAADLDRTVNDTERHNWGFMAPRVNRPGLTLILWKKFDFEHSLMARFPWHTEVWTEAYHMLGQHRRETDVASEGIKQFPAFLTHVFYACRALAARGKVKQLSDLLADAMLLGTPAPPAELREVETFSSAPFRFGPYDYTMGDLYRETGLELRAHGYAAMGNSVIHRAIEWYRERPEAVSGTRRPALAATFIAAGEWDAAKAIYEQLAKEQPDSIDWKGRLGMIAAHQGDSSTAFRVEGELRDLHRRYLFGRNTFWRAVIQAHSGGFDTAVELLAQAKREGWPAGAYMHVAPELAPLHGNSGFQNLITPKLEN